MSVNAATHLIGDFLRFYHLASFTADTLHWLPIHQLLQFKIPTLIRNCAHSFILNIYRALLQENYSEALPTPARLKKSISKVRKKAGDRVVLRDKKFRREAVPLRGAHCGECTVLLSRGTGIRDKEKTLLE